MSLQDQKNSLFGKSSSNPPKSNANKSDLPQTSVTSSHVTKKTIPVLSTTLSPALKSKKLEEAKELSKRGMKHLEKTVFKWNPDYLAAAPLFESSGDIYKQLGDYDIAIAMYLKSAECNEALGALSSAALNITKAAAVGQLKNDKRLTSNLYERVAENWALSGDIDRCAEFLSKAANELEDEDPVSAISLYVKASDYICPPDTSKANLANIHPKAIEIFGLYFKHLLKYTTITLSNSKDQPTYYSKLLALANRMVNIYEAYESESSMCKMLLTITVLQLTTGDTVLADQTFMQDHLNNSKYIRSKECEVAEELIQSFKTLDIERLDKTLQLTQINYLDREVQSLIRRLSLFKAKHNTSSTDYISAADSLSNDLNNLLLSTGVNVEVKETIENSSSKVEEPVKVTENNVDVDEFANANEDNYDDDDEIDLS